MYLSRPVLDNLWSLSYLSTRYHKIARLSSGRGNVLALSCAKNLLYWRTNIEDWVRRLTVEKGAELKNAKGRVRATEVIADTTGGVLNVERLVGFCFGPCRLPALHLIFRYIKISTECSTENARKD